MKLDGSEELFSIFGVIGENTRTKFDFAPRLSNPFAHFERRNAGKGLASLTQYLRRLGDDSGAFVVASAAPFFEARLCGRNFILTFFVAYIIERLEELSVGGRDTGVGHEVLVKEGDLPRTMRRQCSNTLIAKLAFDIHQMCLIKKA
jgi:hypothetical protein